MVGLVSCILLLFGLIADLLELSSFLIKQSLVVLFNRLDLELEFDDLIHTFLIFIFSGLLERGKLALQLFILLDLSLEDVL